MYRGIGDRHGEADALKSIADIALRKGEPTEARLAYDAALQLYRTIGSRLGEANTLVGTGTLALWNGNLPQAKQAYSAALGLFRAIGERVGESDALRGLGVLAWLKGHADTDTLRTSLSLSAAVQDTHGSLVTRTLLAAAEPSAGAVAELDALAASMESLGLPYETCLARALARLRAGDVAGGAAGAIAERLFHPHNAVATTRAATRARCPGSGPGR